MVVTVLVSHSYPKPPLIGIQRAAAPAACRPASQPAVDTMAHDLFTELTNELGLDQHAKGQTLDTTAHVGNWSNIIGVSVVAVLLVICCIHQTYCKVAGRAVNDTDAPELEELAAAKGERLRVAKLDSDEHQQLSSELGVQGLPTVIFYAGGREVHRLEGMPPGKGALAELARQYLGV